ncbi:MAG: sigma-70 family RNA polymerase sigma factor [Lysinibacillus sp.]
MDLEEYIEQYGDYLYRIAFIYMKDQHAAEEVVQDVFMKLYETRQFEGKSSLKTYLTRMTINTCYDYLRKWKARKNQLLDYVLKREHAAEQVVLALQERDEIVESILKLPLKYREVILLYYYDDLTTAEVAALLKVPESTVGTRLQRARQKLKQILPAIEWEVLKGG